MNFIKKIVDGKIDSSVHLQFQKFSRGEFKNRAILKVKLSSGKYTIASTPEFANEMVFSVAKILGEDKARITGAIVSTSDLTGELEFKDKKQFQGVKRYLMDKEMTGTEITNLLEKFPKAFFALSFETEETKLKIKPKAPKSGKPGKKGTEMPKPDFCKLITKNAELGSSFVFEKSDFELAEIYHTFIIESIEIPEELKGSNDFAKIREESLRVGKIIRTAVIDGVPMKKEIPLRA